MAIGFSIFNLTTSAISQTFLICKFSKLLSEQLSLKKELSDKNISEETLNKLSLNFKNYTMAVVGFTFFNLVSTSLISVATIGQEVSLAADLIYSLGATLTFALIIPISHLVINTSMVSEAIKASKQAAANSLA